jgi:hypothetical protein
MFDASAAPVNTDSPSIPAIATRLPRAIRVRSDMHSSFRRWPLAARAIRPCFGALPKPFNLAGVGSRRASVA